MPLLRARHATHAQLLQTHCAFCLSHYALLKKVCTLLSYTGLRSHQSTALAHLRVLPGIGTGTIPSIPAESRASIGGKKIQPPSWSCLNFSPGQPQDDAISISSAGSNEWNISPPPSPTPLQSEGTLIPLNHNPSHLKTLATAARQATDDIPGSERWYAITVGRNPGVYRGS